MPKSGKIYYMASKSDHPMTDALKKAITDSGESLRSIESQTGVKRQSIALFLKGEQSLRLDMADRLASYFGLTVSVSHSRKGKQ